MDGEKRDSEGRLEMTETRLGPSDAGLPPIPEPADWDTSYGIDEAVAIAITPDRALIFWELAQIIEAGIPSGTEFRLVRLKLHGEIPSREGSWPIPPLGRFQDSGLEPDTDYLYVVVRITNGEETPILVTNPIRTPPLWASRGGRPSEPSSYEWMKRVFGAKSGRDEKK